jgi:hypothetical protein
MVRGDHVRARLVLNDDPSPEVTGSRLGRVAGKAGNSFDGNSALPTAEPNRLDFQSHFWDIIIALDAIPTSRYIVNMSASMTQPDARTRLLDAAMQVIRAQGYSATTVDDICRAAGLSKGAFFHHFKSKEDLALAAAAHFSQIAERLFRAAPYRQHADPLHRLLGYVDFRSALLTGPLPGFT